MLLTLPPEVIDSSPHWIAVGFQLPMSNIPSGPTEVFVPLFGFRGASETLKTEAIIDIHVTYPVL